MPEFKDLLYELKDGVVRVTLNRPDKLNALTWSTWAEIEQAFTLASDDDEARVVVITGAGRGFSSGSDLTSTAKEEEWSPRPFQGREALMRTRFRGTEAVYNCPKPTIAAVNGVCVGAGFSLALACDIRIASEAARFSAIFVKRAINADTGATWFLPRLVGPEQALRMFYTGRMVSADEALRIGLVSEVAPADDFEAAVSAAAREIADGPSVAVELMKRLVREAPTQPLHTHIELEQFLQGVTSKTEDVAEGRRAFLEKRDPVFKGR